MRKKISIALLVLGMLAAVSIGLERHKATRHGRAQRRQSRKQTNGKSFPARAVRTFMFIRCLPWPARKR